MLAQRQEGEQAGRLLDYIFGALYCGVKLPATSGIDLPGPDNGSGMRNSSRPQCEQGIGAIHATSLWAGNREFHGFRAVTVLHLFVRNAQSVFRYCREWALGDDKMGDTIALRLLLAFFTSMRKARGSKGLHWCEKYVGGMHEILANWEDGVAPQDKGAATTALNRYCRACGDCAFGMTVRPILKQPVS